MDNTQFKLGQALKVTDSPYTPKNFWKERAKSYYLETWNGFDMNELTAATFVFEGYSNADIVHQESAVYALCKELGGARGDEESGRRGYYLTFMIGYLRDFGLSINFLSEPFEATVPWSQVSAVKSNVETTLRCVAQANNLREPLIGLRISQAYDTEYPLSKTRLAQSMHAV